MSEKAEIHGVCGCGITATCPQCGRINPAHDIVECPRCHWTPPGQKSFEERLWDMASDEYRSFFSDLPELNDDFHIAAEHMARQPKK